MTELFFLVEESPEGGYSARTIGQSIFTQGDDLAEMKRNILACHLPKPLSSPRTGWNEAFKAMHENGDDNLLVPDIFEDETFDDPPHPPFFF